MFQMPLILLMLHLQRNYIKLKGSKEAKPTKSSDEVDITDRSTEVYKYRRR